MNLWVREREEYATRRKETRAGDAKWRLKTGAPTDMWGRDNRGGDGEAGSSG